MRSEIIYFSSFKEVLIANKKLFIFLIFAIFAIDLLSTTFATAEAYDTIDNAAVKAIMHSAFFYAQCVLAMIFTVKMTRTVANGSKIKLKWRSGIMAIVKSAFMWIIMLLFSLMIGVSFFDQEAMQEALVKQDASAIKDAIVLVVVLFILIVMSFAYFTILIQQYTSNSIAKGLGSTDTPAYINGFIVPFWALAQIPFQWRMVLFSLLIFSSMFLENYMVTQGYLELSIVIGSLKSTAFVLVMATSASVAITARFKPF
jgi:hypothetical protein